MEPLEIIHESLKALRAENNADHTDIKHKIDSFSDRLRKVELKTIAITITIATLLSAGVTVAAELIK